jgi:hypothetical protein
VWCGLWFSGGSSPCFAKAELAALVRDRRAAAYEGTAERGLVLFCKPDGEPHRGICGFPRAGPEELLRTPRWWDPSGESTNSKARECTSMSLGKLMHLELTHYHPTSILLSYLLLHLELSHGDNTDNTDCTYSLLLHLPEPEGLIPAQPLALLRS